jgi:hypothetical protein
MFKLAESKMFKATNDVITTIVAVKMISAVSYSNSAALPLVICLGNLYFRTLFFMMNLPYLSKKYLLLVNLIYSQSASS